MAIQWLVDSNSQISRNGHSKSEPHKKQQTKGLQKRLKVRVKICISFPTIQLRKEAFNCKSLEIPPKEMMDFVFDDESFTLCWILGVDLP